MTVPQIIAVPTPAGVRAVFTTRQGGGSTGPYAQANIGAGTGDEPESVRANREALCDLLGVDARRVSMGHQVHGTDVHVIAAPTQPGRFGGELLGWPEGDGLATAAAAVPLVVLGADCMPILLWRADGSAVAAVHAGWRGLVAGIVANAVRALGGATVGAAIGPCAGPCCYEVDDALRARFQQSYGAAVTRGRAVDLALGARLELLRAGVAEDAIHTDGSCTVCQPERFFSYRRDGAATGRQAGVIWRTPV